LDVARTRSLTAARLIVRSRWRARAHALPILLASIGAPLAHAGGGPLGIDYRLSYDNSGIWKRTTQENVLTAVMATVGAGALWEGGEDRLGRTFWQSVDATLASGATTYVLKYAFSRERPYQTSDANKWFTGHGQSFPSGEVTVMSALVTPFVLEYGKESPVVYALELLPAYDAIARMKVWGHWQTDVIAGFGIGLAGGYFMRKLDTPLVFSVMPHGIQIGIKKHL
jgi:undecaprenyl-diphosphatase